MNNLKHFFGSVSRSYKNVVHVLSSIVGITLSYAMPKLLQEELRRKSYDQFNDESSSSVFWARKNSNFQKMNGINTHKILHTTI